MKTIVFLVALLILNVVEGAAEKYQAYAVEGGGSVSGRVTYAGKPSKSKKIIPTADKTICGAHEPIYPEELVVDSASKGVKNVVVYLSNITRGLSTRSMPDPFIDQKGCVFRPHVLIAPVERTVKVLNSDGIIHNIHTQSTKNPTVNLAQPGTLKEVSLNPFKFPEIIKVNCDVHGWMSAWMWVTEHPYVTVTKADGSYQISDIPPGKYKLEFWHEKLGKLTQEITVKKESDIMVDFVYPAK